MTTAVAETVDTAEDDGTTDQDLLEGYKTDAPEPVVVETPEPVAEITPAAEEPKYVQITEAQLTDFVNASKDLSALKDTVHRNVSGMGSKMGSFEATLKKMQEATPAGTKLVVTKEHFKELGEEFPDLVAMTVTGFNRALENMQGTQPVDVDAKVTERFKAEVPNLVLTIKQETAKETVAEKYPEWEQTVHSPEYLAWFKTQPADYQEKIGNSWKAHEVIGSLDTFKTFTETQSKPKPVVTTRPSRMAAAVTPKSAGGGGRGTLSTEESEMVAAYKGK